jgi:hypothetical protein
MSENTIIALIYNRHKLLDLMTFFLRGFFHFPNNTSSLLSPKILLSTVSSNIFNPCSISERRSKLHIHMKLR